MVNVFSTTNRNRDMTAAFNKILTAILKDVDMGYTSYPQFMYKNSYGEKNNSFEEPPENYLWYFLLNVYDIDYTTLKIAQKRFICPILRVGI